MHVYIDENNIHMEKDKYRDNDLLALIDSDVHTAYCILHTTYPH